MSNQKKNSSIENTTKSADLQRETAEAFTEGERGWHKARVTKNLTTRLNANKCLVLSRYFKLLNAMDPNSVVPMWEAFVNIVKPFNKSLTNSMEATTLESDFKDEDDESEEHEEEGE